MNDNLTPRERAEKVIETAGFERRPVANGLYDARWIRDSEVEVGTDTVKLSHSYVRPGEAAFELTVHGEVQHLGAYLNAKELLEACEKAKSLFWQITEHLPPAALRDMEPLWDVLTQAIAKAEGKP